MMIKVPFSGPTSFQGLEIFIICICKPSERDILLRVTISTLYLFLVSFPFSLSVRFIEQVPFSLDIHTKAWDYGH
jgi:hypothetical protein